MSNERRPRLDAVIRAINEGKYDDELVDISKAIEGRTEQLREKVMELVKRTFGEEAVIKTKGEAKPVAKPKPKDTLNVVKHPADMTAFQDLADKADENPSEEPIVAEKPPEAPLTGDFESRSPQFGAIEPEGAPDEAA
jgi:hypothetical protein